MKSEITTSIAFNRIGIEFRHPSIEISWVHAHQLCEGVDSCVHKFSCDDKYSGIRLQFSGFAYLLVVFIESVI